MKKAVAVVAFALALEGAFILQLAAPAASAPSRAAVLARDGRMAPSHVRAAGPCVPGDPRRC